MFFAAPLAGRTLALAGALLLAGSVAGCGEKEAAPPPPEATQTGAVVATASGAVVESEFGTPVKDRVATIGLLNKRNNITQDVVLKSGESRQIGNAIVKLATCEKTAPWEDPQEIGAFVQLFVQERSSTDEQLTWRKAFSGWLFRNAPSLNVVEHPIYDVWVKDCAMTFPGEDAPKAVERSAAKPVGSPSGAAAASQAPAPSPSASASTRAAAASSAE